jgi:hypothetical protein
LFCGWGEKKYARKWELRSETSCWESLFLRMNCSEIPELCFLPKPNCVTDVPVFMCRVNGFLLWIMLCLVMVRSTVGCICGDKFMGAGECV